MKNLDIIPVDRYNIEFLINQGMKRTYRLAWNYKKSLATMFLMKKKVGAGKEIK